MRVVFMGTPEFAVPSLQALAGSHDVVAVFTRPDAASGRGKTLRPSAVKVSADALGLEVYQPTTLRSPEVRELLAHKAVDVIVVAAYGMILPREVLEVPRYGCVNVHASLLPRWRGAAPIQRAILAGDPYVGVSIMKMEEGLDTGPFCAQARIEADALTTEELSAALAELGARLLIESLEKIEAGSCVWTPQDESVVTYADKITREHVALTSDLPVEEALRRVRASSKQAACRLCLDGRSATILGAQASDEAVPAGSVVARKRSLIIGFSDGAIELEFVKPDGKSAMPGCEWARGARFPALCEWVAS